MQSGRPWNRTGTAEPEPQQPNRAEPNRAGTEPQGNPGNRTGKRFLSLSRSLSLSVSLSLSLALSGALSRSVSLSPSLSLVPPGRSLSRSLSLSFALSRALSSLCLSVSETTDSSSIWLYGPYAPEMRNWTGPGKRPNKTHFGLVTGQKEKPNLGGLEECKEKAKITILGADIGVFRPKSSIWGAWKAPSSTTPSRAPILPLFGVSVPYAPEMRKNLHPLFPPQFPVAPCSTTQQGTDSSTVWHSRPLRARNASTIWPPE